MGKNDSFQYGCNDFLKSVVCLINDVHGMFFKDDSVSPGTVTIT